MNRYRLCRPLLQIEIIIRTITLQLIEIIIPTVTSQQIDMIIQKCLH
jgi:hypothetical protein